MQKKVGWAKILGRKNYYNFYVLFFCMQFKGFWGLNIFYFNSILIYLI